MRHAPMSKLQQMLRRQSPAVLLVGADMIGVRRRLAIDRYQRNVPLPDLVEMHIRH